MSRPTLVIILYCIYCIFCTCIFSVQIPNTVTTDGHIGVRLILSSEKCSRGSAEVFMFPSLDINNLATWTIINPPNSQRRRLLNLKEYLALKANIILRNWVHHNSYCNSLSFSKGKVGLVIVYLRKCDNFVCLLFPNRIPVDKL